MWKSQDRRKDPVLFIFTMHVDSSLNSQNALWHVITNYIFIWTITGSIKYIFHEPFIRFPHFSAFLVTPWSSPSWEVNQFSASQEIPHILWDPKFITAFKSTHSTSWRSILKLSSYLCLGLPSGLFPSGFPTKTCIHLSSPPYVLHSPPI